MPRPNKMSGTCPLLILSLDKNGFALPNRRETGRRRMGVVYKAEDTELGRFRRFEVFA